jgi:hypothetical protein
MEFKIFLASSIFSMSDCHLPFFGCSFFMAEIIIALEYLHCLGMALVLSITLLSAFTEFYEPSQQCRILMHSGTECGVIFAKLIFTQHHVDMIESGDWLCKLLVWLG